MYEEEKQDLLKKAKTGIESKAPFLVLPLTADMRQRSI